MRREPALRLVSADLATAANVAGHAHIVWRLVVSLCCLEAIMVKSEIVTKGTQRHLPSKKQGVGR